MDAHHRLARWLRENQEKVDRLVAAAAFVLLALPYVLTLLLLATAPGRSAAPAALGRPAPTSA